MQARLANEVQFKANMTSECAETRESLVAGFIGSEHFYSSLDDALINHKDALESLDQQCQR